MLNMLCLQAELVDLRGGLSGLMSAQLKPDSTFGKDPFKNEGPIDFKPFINDVQCSEWGTLKKIRAKLKEYSWDSSIAVECLSWSPSDSAILEARRMKRKAVTGSKILSIFRNWLISRSRCDESGATPWDRAYFNDLLLLSGAAVMQNSMIHELLYRMQVLLRSTLKPIWPQRSSDEDYSGVRLSDTVRESEAELDQ